jgi:hypothetical protein
MSAIRCDMCPCFNDSADDHASAQRMGGVGWCGHPDRDPEHGSQPRLIYGLSGAEGEPTRPDWCPRRRVTAADVPGRAATASTCNEPAQGTPEALEAKKEPT